MKLKLLFLALLTTGCESMEDIRNYPPIYNEVIPMDYQKLSGCVSYSISSKRSPLYILDSSKQTALISARDEGLPFWEALFINVGTNKTRVEIRRPKNNLDINQNVGIDMAIKAIQSCTKAN